MIMENPKIHPTPEMQEKERHYIIINKKTKEVEIKAVLLPEFNPQPKPESQEEKDRQAIVRPDKAKIHSFTERARNELDLDPDEYILSGPYTSEESAKKELKEFGQSAIPKLIAKEAARSSKPLGEPRPGEAERRGKEEMKRAVN